MRIIGGKLRGRKLVCPKGKGVRPTTDRVREALFQVLESTYGVKWQGIRIMDLFAGSGALGIEALSRGAGHGIFLEHERQAFAALEKNIERCGLTSRAELLRGDVFRLLNRKVFRKSSRPVSLIFADPPYGKGFSSRLFDALSKKGCFLREGGLVVVEERKETDPGRAFRGTCADLVLQEKRIYGDTALFFYAAAGSGK